MSHNMKLNLGADDEFGDPFDRHKNVKTEFIHRPVENVNLNPPLNLVRRNTDIGSANIIRILLTGGPCAGKTTAVADITQDLTQLGCKVLVVPEAATIMMKGGAFIVSTGFTES